MWCELVLNGIGGHTIAAAKENMSQAEFDLWIQYRKRHGSLNLGLRIEQGAGVTAYFTNQGKGQISDDLPQRSPPAEEEALRLAMKEWR